MIADAMDHHGADAVGQIGEAVLDREDDAVIERVALGRTVEADAQYRTGPFDLQQCGFTRGGGGSVSHGSFISFPE